MQRFPQCFVHLSVLLQGHTAGARKWRRPRRHAAVLRATTRHATVLHAPVCRSAASGFGRAAVLVTVFDHDHDNECRQRVLWACCATFPTAMAGALKLSCRSREQCPATAPLPDGTSQLWHNGASGLMGGTTETDTRALNWSMCNTDPSAQGPGTTTPHPLSRDPSTLSRAPFQIIRS